MQRLGIKEVTVESQIMQKVTQIIPIPYLDTSPFITTTMITKIQRKVRSIIMKVNFIFQFSNFFVLRLIIVTILCLFRYTLANLGDKKFCLFYIFIT